MGYPSSSVTFFGVVVGAPKVAALPLKSKLLGCVFFLEQCKGMLCRARSLLRIVPQDGGADFLLRISSHVRYIALASQPSSEIRA